MERRAEYTTCPEFDAAGLDLVAAELTICELREELERLRGKYALALCVIRCLQAYVRRIETTKHG